MTYLGVVPFIHTGNFSDVSWNGTQAIPYGFAERVLHLTWTMWKDGSFPNALFCIYCPICTRQGVKSGVKIVFRKNLTNSEISLDKSGFSLYNTQAFGGDAAIAQSVERILGKDEVASSNLASSSTKRPANRLGVFV